MTREEVKEILPILQAYANGKTILYENGSENITDLAIGNFEKNAKRYRIKPEPTYRPFANTEECWKEMEKHQPFGWVKDKKDGYYVLITAVDNGDYMSLSGNSGWSFYSLMKDYTFADGVPFGVKVEE